MDRAESLMESFPDTSLLILEKVNPLELKEGEAQARYGLLKSMAYDKNYIDTTSFEVLQPAIDYYLKKGTPDEKIRTLYYKACIHYHRGENEQAMKALVAGEAMINQITDSLTLARNFRLQSLLYENQCRMERYIEYALRGAEIYDKLNRPELRMDNLVSAFNGFILLEDKNRADSVMSIIRHFPDSMYNRNLHAVHTMILYAGEFLPPEEAVVYLDSISTGIYHPDLRLDLAYGYANFGEGEKAFSIFEGINENELKDRLKYLAIKVKVLEAMGKYKEALEVNTIYSALSDSTYRAIFAQDVGAMEQVYILENDALTEKNRKKNVVIAAVSGGAFFIILILIILLVLRHIKINNLNLENKALRLSEERSAALAREEQGKLELEKIKEELKSLHSERDEIHRILSDNEEERDEIQKRLYDRLCVLNGLIASKISENDRYAEAYNSIEKDIKNNKKRFLHYIKETVTSMNPQFMKKLEDAGLDAVEIDYICLYALGLKGKDIGNYLDTSRHYIVSSNIRKKLGLTDTDTNISLYIQSRMKYGRKTGM
ncbi:MAG: hypothetical protein K2J70_04605 [Muribaculaceae bacterium]|nr:hypothetical protein [Muribaculaceae bacterium]